MFRKTSAVAAVIGLTMMAAPAAQATTVTINSFDNGWYLSDGRHTPQNSNIIERPGYNNFFAFDLSGVSMSSITSAVLTIFGDNGDYRTSDASERIDFYDVSTPIDALVGGTGGVAAFNDLGTGTTYGSANILTPNSSGRMPQVTTALAAPAITAILNAINGTDQRFAIGGSSPTVTSNQRLWGFSAGVPAASLTLTYTAPTPPPNPTPTPTPAPVPLPAAGWLLLAGMAGLGFMSRRRKSA